MNTHGIDGSRLHEFVLLHFLAELFIVTAECVHVAPLANLLTTSSANMTRLIVRRCGARPAIVERKANGKKLNC